MSNSTGKRSSLAWVMVAYLTAIPGGYIFIRLFPQDSLLLNALYADLIATVIIFLFSMLFNNSSMYDPYWSLVPPFIIIYWIVASGVSLTLPIWLLIASIIFWGIRLTLNWARDWGGMEHEDWRYVEFRKKFGSRYWLVSLGGIHLFPTAIVFLGIIPAFFAITKGPETLNIFHIIGFICSVGGTLIALSSDEQLRSFRRSGDKRTETIDSGLWKYSRHPNYLGENMNWIGIWFFALGAGMEYSWTIIAPLSMIAMFLFVSVPWMERKLLSNRPEYQDYIEKVPRLIPIRLKKKN